MIDPEYVPTPSPPGDAVTVIEAGERVVTLPTGDRLNQFPPVAVDEFTVKLIDPPT